MTATLPTPRYRPLRFGVTQVTTRPGDNGTLYVRATQDLEPHPVRLTDRLAHWAEATPERARTSPSARARIFLVTSRPPSPGPKDQARPNRLRYSWSFDIFQQLVCQKFGHI